LVSVEPKLEKIKFKHVNLMKNIMETLEILSPWRNNQNLVQLVKAKLGPFGFG